MPALAPINLLGGTYMLIISIVIICFLSSQSLFLHAELKQLNNSIAKIGHGSTEPNAELLVQELRSHLNWHLIIAERIRIISCIFEVGMVVCFDVKMLCRTCFWIKTPMTFQKIAQIYENDF